MNVQLVLNATFASFHVPQYEHNFIPLMLLKFQTLKLTTDTITLSNYCTQKPNLILAILLSLYKLYPKLMCKWGILELTDCRAVSHRFERKVFQRKFVSQTASKIATNLNDCFMVCIISSDCTLGQGVHSSQSVTALVYSCLTMKQAMLCLCKLEMLCL